MSRQINILQRPAQNPKTSPTKPKNLPPLVFVHGGYMQAGCWEVAFFPCFQALGYDCWALDLSGHGASAGRDQLDQFGLDDYADDLEQLLQGLNAPAVLVGHSMGALVVQRYLERPQAVACAAVMMAPVPPTGVAGAAWQLALRQPNFFAETERALRGEFDTNSLRVIREVYFSPDVDEAQCLAFVSLIQPESNQAILEMTTLAMRWPVKRMALPILVIGGEKDALFPANMLHFSASGWAQMPEICVIPRAGHMLMLDPQSSLVAEKIAAWLVKTLV